MFPAAVAAQATKAQEGSTTFVSMVRRPALLAYPVGLHNTGHQHRAKLACGLDPLSQTPDVKGFVAVAPFFVHRLRRSVMTTRSLTKHFAGVVLFVLMSRPRASA